MINQDMTIGRLHAYLKHSETKSAEYIFSQMHLRAINHCIAQWGEHQDITQEAIKRELKRIRATREYKQTIEFNNKKSPSVKERITAWITNLLITENK